LKKEEGRRKKEEGRRKKEEGRRKKEEGRRKKEASIPQSCRPISKRATSTGRGIKPPTCG
jgi:hypothetical protein